MNNQPEVKKIAVIDTETNWHDEVMSIGVVLADSETFQPQDVRYYILTPEVSVGGMYSEMLFLKDDSFTKTVTRNKAVDSIREYFGIYGVSDIFAYNGRFDRGHLAELSDYNWYDIMKVAYDRRFNRAIPSDAPCCKTGRMKRGYNVQSMIRILSGVTDYFETHNALIDALDELQIMRLLEQKIDVFYKNSGI